MRSFIIIVVSDIDGRFELRIESVMLFWTTTWPRARAISWLDHAVAAAPGGGLAGGEPNEYQTLPFHCGCGAVGIQGFVGSKRTAMS
jgi:hypothetical protein